MVNTRSPSSRNFTFCSAISSDRPPARHLSSDVMTVDTSSGDSPAEGSSITSSRGSAASALAMPSILRCPPDRLPPGWRRFSVRMGNSAYSSSRRRRAVPPSTNKAPSRMFSSTVRSGKMPSSDM